MNAHQTILITLIIKYQLYEKTCVLHPLHKHLPPHLLKSDKAGLQGFANSPSKSQEWPQLSPFYRALGWLRRELGLTFCLPDLRDTRCKRLPARLLQAFHRFGVWLLKKFHDKSNLIWQFFSKIIKTIYWWRKFTIQYENHNKPKLWRYTIKYTKVTKCTKYYQNFNIKISGFRAT